MKDKIYKILNKIFTVTMILFVLMTAIIVVGQVIGIIIGNGELVLGINSALKTYATWVSTVCGLVAMMAYNFMPKDEKDDDGPSSIGPAKNA